CRDPGGTELGEAIRRILLDSSLIRIDRRSEMLLYMAARAQMVEEVISPALAAGKTVVSDRYLLANVVYQGHAVGPSTGSHGAARRRVPAAVAGGLPGGSGAAAGGNRRHRRRSFDRRDPG